MSDRQAAVRGVLDRVKADGRTSLTAPECKEVCDAYGIPLPQEGLATSADEAASIAAGIGYPVVMKIVSPDILHKTEAGGVLVGVADDAAAKAGFESIMANAKAYKGDADLTGVQIQQMVSSDGQEVIVGAVTDPSFGKLVAFGLGGILVEVLKDITFRLAPATNDGDRPQPDPRERQRRDSRRCARQRRFFTGQGNLPAESGRNRHGDESHLQSEVRCGCRRLRWRRQDR
jgi:acyl-CoA synthetase (NDP forming)